MTLIVGILCRDGIVVAADRASSAAVGSHPRSFVSCRQSREAHLSAVLNWKTHLRSGGVALSHQRDAMCRKTSELRDAAEHQRP